MLSLDARLSPGFRRTLVGLDIDRLESDASTIYGLSPDLTIGYFNPAYVRFALENGGDDCLFKYRLGVSVLAAISDPIRGFYADRLEAVRETKQPWEHVYECPSPTTARRYRVRVLPIGERSLLAVHAAVVEASHAPSLGSAAPRISAYVDGHGMIHQCSHCRRVRRNDDREWDFVPSLLALPPYPVSHGLCGLCYAYYFPEEPT